jgi:phenylalanyl-tRNA synthetase beta chain
MKKFSKKWMQTYLVGQLPNDKEIVEQVSKKGFEVESVENTNDGDSLYEIKVLPNRVADAYCLSGMANEFASILNLERKDLVSISMFTDIGKYERNDSFVEIQDKDTLCYFGVAVEIDKQIETPAWVKDILTKSGGRSINSLVDITNLMLYGFGQPTHVFDMEKLKGKVITRLAKKGESITLLDGKVLELTETDNLICDEKNVLALAGIKGGSAGEVDEDTTYAFFEIANFDRNQVRKSSVNHGVRTDASKIYENGLSMAVTEDVLTVIVNTILEIYPSAKIKFISKQYSAQYEENPYISFTPLDVQKMAGVQISETNIVNGLSGLRFEFKQEGQTFSVKAPKERLDVKTKEDVLEEVIRLYGYDNIIPVPLKVSTTDTHNISFLVTNFIQNFLLQKGFTEIFNYTFVAQGEVKVLLPLAEDKAWLRTNLLDGAKKSFDKNYNFLPLMEMTSVKFFEIGSIFLKDKEEKRCVICLEDNKKKSKNTEQILSLIKELEQVLNVKIDLVNKCDKPAMVEFSIGEIVAQKPSVSFTPFGKNLKDVKYKTISVYPFITRDIAAWVPSNYTTFEALRKELLGLSLQNAEKIYKFDEFTKEGEYGQVKTSIAFRIIFQSYDKTLTDAEVELEMNKVASYLSNSGFTMR